MTTIRHLEISDKEFWYSLDKHLPETEFENKVYTKRGYILSLEEKPIGLLRYNLFWDSVPFCTMLFIDRSYQRKGYGKQQLQLLLDYAKSSGMTSVIIACDKSNIASARTAISCGGILTNEFVEDGRVKQHYHIKF